MDKKELKFEILNDLGTISESTKGWSKNLLVLFGMKMNQNMISELGILN